MNQFLSYLKWSLCIALLSIQWVVVSAHPKDALISGFPMGVEFAPNSTILGTNVSCVGQMQSYIASGPIGSTYAWSSPGGVITPVTVPSTLVTWMSPGVKTLTLTTTTGGSTSVATLTVTVSPQPTPSISTSFIADCPDKKIQHGVEAIIIPTPPKECWKVCENSVVNYWTTNVPGNTYQWVVVGGTPTTASGSSISVTWGPTGSGSVTLTETAPGGCFKTEEKCIDIIESPHAKFLFNDQYPSSPLVICLNQTVYFADLSEGAYHWLWDFGDGTTSVFQNPDHPYNVAGVYNGSLTVTNECGCTDVLPFTIIVKDLASPVIGCISTVCLKDCAFYSVGNLSNCPGAIVEWTIHGGQIINNPTNASVNVVWDDSDGYIQANGFGYICVKVSGCPDLCDGEVCARVPVIHQVTIHGDQDVCVGDPVTYTVPIQPGINEPGGSPNGVNFDWIVSAGGTIISTSPYSNSITVVWNSPGTGWVDMEAYENYLTDGECVFDPEPINITIRPVFTISPANTTICLGTVSPSYFSTAAGTTVWSATGPTGTISLGSTSGSPMTFTPTASGVYVISGTSTSGVYCPVSPTAVLTVLPVPPMPTGILTGELVVCPNTPYTYTLSNLPPPGSVLIWSATNGTLSGVGGQTVTVQWSGVSPMILSVKAVGTQNPACPSAAKTWTITNYAPPSNFVSGPSPVCVNETKPYTILPSGLSRYTDLQWSVFPATAGSVVSGQGLPTANILFNTSAPATVQVICTAIVCGSPVTAQLTVTVNQVPTYTLTTSAPLSTTCQGESVTLTLSSSPASGMSGIASYLWNFGDGSPTSTAPSPTTHVWGSTGTFPISVQLNLNICNNPTVFATGTINVLPIPIVNVTSSNGYKICAPVTSLNLTATTQFACNYVWSGSPAIPGPPPTTAVITVTTPGTYTVVATNPLTGCSSSYTTLIVGCGNCTGCSSTLNPWTFTSAESCDTYTFTPSAGTAPSAAYVGWDFGDGTGSATSGTQTHTYLHPGYYQVVLTSVDATQSPACYMKYVQNISVKFKGGFSNTFNCSGGTMQTILTDRSEYLPPFATAPQWWEGATNLGTGSVLTTTLTPGPHVIYLRALIAGNWCYSPSQTIIVPALPVAMFTPSPTPVCEGTPVSFTNTSTGGGITGFTWAFGDGATSGLTSPQREYSVPANTIYTVVLTMSSNWGCSSTASANVNIKNSGANPTFTIAPGSPQCAGTPISITAVPTGLPPTISYNWFNSVAPATSLSVANPFTPTISGTYGVKVVDGNACKYNVLAPPIVYIPPPFVQIIGATDYCPGELIKLSAENNLMGYTYSWLVTPPSGPAFLGSTISSISLFGTPGTYTFSVTITGPAPSFCTNTGSITVVVRPNVTGLSISASPNCEPSTLTASVTSTDPVNYNWSTGDNSPTTYVVQGGFYAVVATNSWGCSASTTYDLPGKPDLSNVMTGCYEYCENVTWQAPACSGCTYQWYENGILIPGEVNATIVFDHSAVYTVVVSNGPGCSAESDPIDISITNSQNCHKCKLEYGEANFECVGIDPISGNPIYEFTMNVTNYGGALYGFFATTTLEAITIDNPASGFLPGGGTTTAVHGYIIWNGQQLDGCIDFTGYLSVSCEQEERCELRWCGELPKCCDLPCDLKILEAQVECIGNGYYKVTMVIKNNGCPLFNASIKTVYGYVPLTPSTLPNGITTVMVTIHANPGANVLTVCGVKYDGKKCCAQIVRDFPDCGPVECNVDVRANEITCIGGNPVRYQFNFDVYGVPPGSSVLVFPTQAGSISGLTYTCSGGVCNVQGTFTPVNESNILCFEVLTVSSTEPPIVCFGKVCFEVPPCPGAKPAQERTKEAFSNPAGANTFYLIPNPATDIVSLGGLDPAMNVLRIQVTDMVGQNRIDMSPSGKSIQLDIRHLPSGMYNVIVTDGNGVPSSKKLVVVR